MKLLKTIATAAVISTSLFAATPAEAFWGTGEGKATYENLQRSDYMFNYKTQAKVYDSPGWLLMTVDANDGWVQKMKLIDCRGSKCMYFKRKADNPEKYVWVYEIDCFRQKQRSRSVHSSKAHWGSWQDIWADEFKVAFNKFCR